MTRAHFAKLVTPVLIVACSVAVSGAPAFAARETATPTTWTAPAQSHSGYLTAVSCVRATRCFAVGITARSQPLVEQWNGSRWTVMPTPATRKPSVLTGISCPSASRCVAVGGVFDATGRASASLIEMWNGRRWSIVPHWRDLTRAFDGVSCATPTSCVAVSSAYNYRSGAAAFWNGKRWSVSPLPTLPFGLTTDLTGVSCVTATHCVAVGSVSGYESQTLVETWDGTGWTITATPVRTNSRDRSFAAVSCVSETSCFAVGRSGRTDADPSLIERWDGIRWTELPGARGIGYVFSSLSSISCVSSTSCVAVGSGLSGHPVGVISRTLVETWDGQRWTVAPSITRGTQRFSGLAGVSCTPEQCVAVGTYHGDAWEDGRTLVVSGVVSPRAVKVAWSAAENARLQQVAAYLHVSPARVQKVAVYGTAYLAGLGRGDPSPVTVPPMGCCVSYTTVWDQAELGTLDSVRVKFELDSATATRFSVYLLSYLLAVGGH